MSWTWPKVDKMELARLVLDNAKDWLIEPRLSVNWNDLNVSIDGRKQLLCALYETLCRYRITYTPEKYQPDQSQQLVRTPDEILGGSREGTCLDLSLLFCGLCMGCHLIPWLVIIKGHALVLVSMNARLPEWKHLSRAEWKEFRYAPLTDMGIVNRVLTEGRYMAVECTGFARSDSLPASLPEGQNRNTDGFLSFEMAVQAGTMQLNLADRPLEYVIDVAVARFEWQLEAYDLRLPRLPVGGPSPVAVLLSARDPSAPPRELVDDLPLLTDRTPQTGRFLESLGEGLSTSSSLPAVFFIEGDLDQGHAGLVRRLVRFELPGWLESRVRDPSVIDVHVVLPGSDTSNFDRALRSELGLKLSMRGNYEPTWTDVAARLRDRPGRVLFRFTFSTSDWEQDQQERLVKLLRSWEQCASIPTEGAPIVCVQVIYEPRQNRRLSWWFGTGGGNANKRLKAYLEERLQADLATGQIYPGVSVVLLKPLDDVTAGNLADWQNRDEVRGISRGHDFSIQIRELFQDIHDRGRKGLPMDEVVHHLRNWLEPFARGA